MEFLEGGIYRPIRVLFDTMIYDRALQLCWTITSYKSKIAVMHELLSLQQKNQIPSQVTAEDMINLLLEESKNTLREHLWEFELEDFDEEDAKPLLMLVWAVNVNNKMRDVECEARLLLNSPEALPPNFRHPKVLSTAKDYARILRQKQKEAPSFKRLSPKEVVFEVVPRVLQGFWVLPPRLLLNMPSQRLSKMSVGVTKAVLDQVSNAFAGVERQVTFSRSIRDEMVMSILTKIRQTHPHDILVNRIKNFAPVLLSEIVEVAAGHISVMFQPQSPKVPAHQTPAVEPPATTPVQHDVNRAGTEELPTPSPEMNSAAVSPPSGSPTSPPEPQSITDVEAREDEDDKHSLQKDPKPSREPASAAVLASLTPPAEPPFTDVEAREDVNDKPCLDKDPEPSGEPASAVVPPILTPPAEPPSNDVEAREDANDKPFLQNDPEPSGEPASAAVPPTVTPPADPPSTDVEAREDENDEANLTDNSKPSGETASAATPAPLAPLTPPAEAEILTGPQDGLTTSLAETEQPTSSPVTSSAEVSPPPAPRTSTAEPLCIIDVQDREDTNERPSMEEGENPSREPASALTASSAPRTPPLDPVVTVTVNPEVKETRAQRFFRTLFQSLCCCFVASDTDNE